MASADGADGTGEGAATGSVPGRLLELQAVDTEGDQAARRRERLPERDEVSTQTALLRAWEERRTSLRRRRDELDQVIESAEAESSSLGDDRSRLEAQLKTIIAPREAEALMNEIETVTARRDELDVAELAALEEQVAVDEDLATHVAEEEVLRSAYAAAEAALGERLADVDAELAQIAERRTALRATLPDALLERYDSARAQLGVAIARLDGRRCSGCHLDLSAAEVDDARDDAAGPGGTSGITECPHCGRMLVV